MRLRPQTQCALRIMVTLSREPRPVTQEELADATKTSPALVSRTLAALEQALMVKRVGDGHRLGFHPRAIYVADILDAARGEIDAVGCPLASGGCSHESPCALCWTLIEADLAAMHVLRTQTLEDLRRVTARRDVSMKKEDLGILQYENLVADGEVPWA